MKKVTIIFLSLFTLLLTVSNSYSENKIVYIDVEKIMTESKAGKSIKDQLEKMAKSNVAKFKKMEDELKSEEKKIIAKKNVLSKEEFQKKINDLRVKANNYRKTRNENIDQLTKKRLEATGKFLKQLNPILAKYSEDQKIGIIVQKKNIIVGKSELDITSDILKIVNDKIKSFNLN